MAWSCSPTETKNSACCRMSNNSSGLTICSPCGALAAATAGAGTGSGAGSKAYASAAADSNGSVEGASCSVAGMLCASSFSSQGLGGSGVAGRVGTGALSSATTWATESCQERTASLSWRRIRTQSQPSNPDSSASAPPRPYTTVAE
ncbi:hypothetical protein SDC9_205380 [bioreactor metagenome]|uniref:Uncharacterized protein n=1 Tax=bioreactor metagenome TaxID=1076179 RepID=A0A645J2M9_9ZZZZ